MNTPIKMRNYGRIIQDLIDYVVTLPEDEQRDQLVRTLAVAMSNRNLLWNRDQEPTPLRVVRDLEILSEGRLTISVEQLDEVLSSAKTSAQQTARNTKNHRNRTR